MPSNNYRSLKATLYSTYLDFKTTYGIITIILLCIFAAQTATAVWPHSGSYSSNISALNAGFITALWGIPISLIVMTSSQELLKKFSFPVERKTLAISHLIYLLLAPLVILLTSCGFYLLEYLLFSVIQSFNSNVIYLWINTKESFLTGFFLSYCAIVLLSAATYLLFMYFYRYKLVTSALVCTFIFVFLTLTPFNNFVEKLVHDLLFGENPWLLCVIYLGLSLIFWTLAFIPLKRMEVKK